MSQIHSKAIAKQITATTPAVIAIMVLLSFSFSLLNLFSPLLHSLLPGLYLVASVVQTSSVTSSVCSDAGVAVGDSEELFVTLEGFVEGLLLLF